MFCKNCGKQISEDSKFCQFCGVKVNATESTRGENAAMPEERQANTIWDKFIDIYNSKGDIRKKYEDFSSSEARELLNRLSINAFEGFIEEHKDVLNKQPYKAIEVLKSTYQLSVTGGYWLWMAEAILKTNLLNKLKAIELEKLIEEWKKLAIDDYAQTLKEISEELMTAISNFHNFRMETLFESVPTIKELSNEFIEKLKSNLIIQIIWGYAVGLVESKYKK